MNMVISCSVTLLKLYRHECIICWVLSWVLCSSGKQKNYFMKMGTTECSSIIIFRFKVVMVQYITNKYIHTLATLAIWNFRWGRKQRPKCTMGEREYSTEHCIHVTKSINIVIALLRPECLQNKTESVSFAFNCQLFFFHCSYIVYIYVCA